MAGGGAPRRSGFTLMELMVTLTVLAIVATAALPSFAGLLDALRLSSAAEAIAGELQSARSEAVKRGRAVAVSFSPPEGAAWCFGSGARGCDCSLVDPAAPRACVLSVAGVPVLQAHHGGQFPRVRLLGANFSGKRFAEFHPFRALSGAGRVDLEGASGQRLRVVVSLLGRVRICAPAGRIAGYPKC